MIVLDATDRRILRALQADGRLTNQELAEKVNLSASQCSRRRSQLEREGVITGYRALVDRSVAGLGVAAFVNVGLASHSRDSAARFAAYVAGIDEVVEAYALTGDMDYHLKVVVADLESLSRLINGVLLPHEMVATVRTTIILDTLKDHGGLPL